MVNDNNNNYIELNGNEINTVQLVEPSLDVSPTFFYILKFDEEKNSTEEYKYAFRIPLIYIDDFKINNTYISSFQLDYNEFIPSLVFEFVDTSNRILSTATPKSGSLIHIYIGGYGDDSYYKPISQDFILTDIRTVGCTGKQNYGDWFKYRVYGKLNVPNGYARTGITTSHQQEISYIQLLSEISTNVGLGFATNFTNDLFHTCKKYGKNNTESNFDYLQRLVGHAYYSPYTFFTSFIDQYNVLNFIECHSLLSHGGNKTDVETMIYNSFPTIYSQASNNVENSHTLPSDVQDKYQNIFQNVSYYFISNNDYFNGYTNFIEEYQVISNGNSLISYGEEIKVIFDDNSMNTTIKPIDNLKRDNNGKIIQLDDEPHQNSYIPMIVNTSDVVTNIDFGNIKNGNTQKEYYYADVQNTYQLKWLKKCGLKIRLQNYNPSITKFSRIWVDIYDKNVMSIQNFKKSEISDNEKGTKSEELKKKRNENLLKFENEGLIENMGNEDGQGHNVNTDKNKSYPRSEYNRGLSGWYVITGMEIFYEPSDVNLKMNLILNRIEFQPNYKSEYERIKNKIKYN